MELVLRALHPFLSGEASSEKERARDRSKTLALALKRRALSLENVERSKACRQATGLLTRLNTGATTLSTSPMVANRTECVQGRKR